MPELPEVEVTRLGLLPHLPGKRVKSVATSNKRLRSPIPRTLLREYICNNTIADVERRAKYLLLRMVDSSTLLFHLGMTGKLGLFPAGTSLDKHDHLRLRLDNDSELRFNDSRRFGLVAVWPAQDAQELERAFEKRIGLEPLSPAFSSARLEKIAASRNLPVKSFLMDARCIAGIGNIYANETLHLAGIHPLTPASGLRREHWHIIVKECRKVLRRAIKAGGSTISDFIGASGQPGYFQLQLAVYGRKGEPCSRCGKNIEKMIIGGRASFYCPMCQPMIK
jgi:formamidopyrimidine-DNA glycosylase